MENLDQNKQFITLVVVAAATHHSRTLASCNEYQPYHRSVPSGCIVNHQANHVASFVEGNPRGTAAHAIEHAFAFGLAQEAVMASAPTRHRQSLVSHTFEQRRHPDTVARSPVSTARDLRVRVRMSPGVPFVTVFRRRRPEGGAPRPVRRSGISIASRAVTSPALVAARCSRQHHCLDIEDEQPSSTFPRRDPHVADVKGRYVNTNHQ